jgi:RNA polymerase sigma factor (sigma-70 family)
MTDDSELLRRYVDARSEAAFAELVQRHLGLVYHTALRSCGGDAHRARDVAQSVFTDLGRKAATLARRPAITGWLYTSTRYAAAQAVRTEVRRQAREKEAQVLNESTTDADAVVDWSHLQPVIDDALRTLGERDREAVLLRFFEGRAFAELGKILSVTEDAARMRVERALAKMRPVLARHGVTSTTAALAVALSTQSGAAVPAGMAAAITGQALAGSAIVTMGGAWAAFSHHFVMGKLQTGIITAVAAVGVGGFIVETRATSKLTDRVDELRVHNVAMRDARAERSRLAQAVVVLSPSHADKAEVERLKKRVEELSSAGPRMIRGNRSTSRAEALLARRRSPYIAYQSIVSSVVSNDRDTLAQLVCFDAAGQQTLEEFFRALPPEMQRRAQTPEQMAAQVFELWRWKGDRPAQFGSSVREIPVSVDAELKLSVTYKSGRTVEDESFRFKRFEDGWRLGPMSRADVDEILALLDPRTGQPRSLVSETHQASPR